MAVRRQRREEANRVGPLHQRKGRSPLLKADVVMADRRLNERRTRIPEGRRSKLEAQALELNFDLGRAPCRVEARKIPSNTL